MCRKSHVHGHPKTFAQTSPKYTPSVCTPLDPVATSIIWGLRCSPAITAEVATYPGRPGLFSQLRKSEEIGDRFGSRMASIDLLDARLEATR